FEAAQKSLGAQPFVKQYVYIKAVFNQRKIHPPRTWESAAVVLVMLGVWGGTGAAAIGLWPHKEVKAAAAAPDTRTNNQRAFDNAFDAYDYDEEVKGAAALSEIEALGAKLEASDARHIDLATLKALALPLQDRLPQFELLIKEQRNGMSYDVAL